MLMCVSLRVLVQWELIKTVKILPHSSNLHIYSPEEKMMQKQVELLDLQCVGEHIDNNLHVFIKA